MERFFRRPWLIVAVISMITVFFGFQLKNVSLDNNNYRFVPKTDPSRVMVDYTEETFGSQVFVLIGLDRKYDTVFDADFLTKIQDFDSRAEKMNLVESVDSLLSADYITSDGDAIVVQSIASDNFSGSEEELAQIKHRVLSWDMYRNSLISDDLKATQILVKFDVPLEHSGNAESLAALDEVKKLAKEIFEPETAVYVAGMPVFSSDINSATSADLRLLIPLVVLVVILVLFLSYRRAFAVVIPLLTVIIATIWSMGAMPLFGVRLSVLSTVMPVILIAVGSAYGIHVVTHYIGERELQGTLTRAAHQELVFELVRRIGKPVFMAALTTFAGFVSFCFTEVLPIREFGFFASFGVLVAFAVSLTLIPSLFLIIGPVPLKRKAFSKAKGKDKAQARDPLSDAIAEGFVSIAHKKHSVIAVAAVLVIVSVAGLSRLIIDNVLVEYFKDDTDVVASDRFIREKFGGSKVLDVLVKSDKAGGVLDPDVLTAMDSLGSYLEHSVPGVGKVTSFTDLVKRINQVYNANESPKGIAPAAAQADSGDSGFGDFGTFEADGAGADGAAAPALETDAESPTSPIDLKAVTAALSDASYSGTSYRADVESLVESLRLAVNYEGATYYEIPSNPAKYGKSSKQELENIVSNYMVLLSGDISSYANDPLEPTVIRMNLMLKTTGQLDTHRVVAKIEEYARAKFPKSMHVEVGGTALVEAVLSRLVVNSQLSSVIISLLGVFLIISFSYKSLVAGLIGIIPLSLSILMNFAIMGFFGIKLNIGTALVASLTVGVGIDYIIHYMESYYRERKAGGDFLPRTFRSSGKAILINAVSVGAGFTVLLLSQFNLLASLGFLIAFTMFSSSMIAMTLLPVILNWLNPAFLDKEF